MTDYRSKRLLDVVVAAVALIFCSPVMAVLLLVIWLEDGRWPIYAGERAGLGGKRFRMYKARTMFVDADANHVDTTKKDDVRITKVGRVARATKLDELPQFWNVLVGDMSLVGPRPNVSRETAIYTPIERELLSIRPGITDLASIAFSNLGERISGAGDANLAYNQLIRPWKSKLALLYLHNRSWRLDTEILIVTAIAVFAPAMARRRVAKIATTLGGTQKLADIVTGQAPLFPTPPPGALSIVTSRTLANRV